MHNKFQGLILNDAQLSIAATFFNQYLDDKGMQELRQFIRNRESHNYLAKSCAKKIFDFALNIFMIPASTASLEGLFSN